MTAFEICLCAGVTQFTLVLLLTFGRIGWTAHLIAQAAAAVPTFTLAYILATYALEAAA